MSDGGEMSRETFDDNKAAILAGLDALMDTAKSRKRFRLLQRPLGGGLRPALHGIEDGEVVVPTVDRLREIGDVLHDICDGLLEPDEADARPRR